MPSRTHRFPSLAARVAGVAVAALALIAPAPVLAPPPSSTPGSVIVGTIKGAIGPATTLYVERLLQTASARDARCVILRIDTPGGLADAMRDIIQAIFASPVPVVTYFSPEGARAASAGALIALSAHVSVMAPGTNIGAAHPVSIGAGAPDSSGVMEKKVTNDAAAYARSLATRRGRNVEWAEQVVRESISSTADEAVAAKAVDFVAANIKELLQGLDGRTVDLPQGSTVLQFVADAAVVDVDPSFRERFLSRISDPNIAYLLMLAGLFGILFELQNPGAVLPGVVGALALVTGAFAFQMLPISWTGAALIALALVLFILEIKVTSHGALTIGGIVAMLVGSIMLIDSPQPFMRVSLSVIIPSVLFTALFFLFAVGMGVRAQRRRVTTGREGLVGEEGSAKGDVHVTGSVFVHGEFWNATSDEPISDGSRVEVMGVEGLKLKVRRKAP